MIEQGLKRLFEGLLSDMEPALKDLGTTLQGYEPLLRELAALMGDLENYQTPERLPNGDILLRRKFGAPPPPALPDSARPPAPPREAPGPRPTSPDDQEAIDL